MAQSDSTTALATKEEFDRLILQMQMVKSQMTLGGFDAFAFIVFKAGNELARTRDAFMQAALEVVRLTAELAKYEDDGK